MRYYIYIYMYLYKYWVHTQYSHRVQYVSKLGTLWSSHFLPKRNLEWISAFLIWDIPFRYVSLLGSNNQHQAKGFWWSFGRGNRGDLIALPCQHIFCAATCRSFEVDICRSNCMKREVENAVHDVRTCCCISTGFCSRPNHESFRCVLLPL